MKELRFQQELRSQGIPYMVPERFNLQGNRDIGRCRWITLRSVKANGEQGHVFSVDFGKQRYREFKHFRMTIDYLQEGI